MNNCKNLQETAALGAGLSGDDGRNAYFFNLQFFLVGVFVGVDRTIISIQACSPSRRLFESRRRECASGRFDIRDRLPMCRLTVAWPFSSVQ